MEKVYSDTDYTSETSFQSDFKEWEEELIVVDFSSEEVELVANRVSPPRSWPESDNTNIPTEAQYNGRLAFRAGNAEHALDTVRSKITSEDTAKMWTILKLRAIELQDSSLYDGKSEDINALADEVTRFVSGFDFNADEYERVSNK